jgi:hypothetical protein
MSSGKVSAKTSKSALLMFRSKSLAQFAPRGLGGVVDFQRFRDSWLQARESLVTYTSDSKFLLSSLLALVSLFATLVTAFFGVAVSLFPSESKCMLYMVFTDRYCVAGDVDPVPAIEKSFNLVDGQPLVIYLIPAVFLLLLIRLVCLWDPRRESGWKTLWIISCLVFALVAMAIIIAVLVVFAGLIRVLDSSLGTKSFYSPPNAWCLEPDPFPQI